jgi:uncharacterized protein (TIGR02246 family)
MKITTVVIALTLFTTAFAADASREAEVRQTVQAFYTAFGEGFVKPVEFAATDWYHISPFGGVDKGLEAVLKDVRTVHTTFLKGTTDTINDMSVRFASNTAAVATVVSTMSPFTAPDGITHGAEKHIRTFVVAKRGGRWLIMQDQNTTVAGPPG